MYKSGDKIKTENSYTIVTKNGTLYRTLPSGYVLEGIVVDVVDSFYQNDDNVNKLIMERISKNPSGNKLKKEYVLWQRKSNEEIII